MELEDNPPLLSYLVGRLDRAIRQRLRQILAPLELSIPQFTTLSVLSRRPGLSNAQLARRAFMTPQSMNEVITGLERRGLLARAPTAAHGGVLAAELTAAGRTLVRRAERATLEFERELAAVLGDDAAFTGVSSALQSWVEHLRAAPQPPAGERASAGER